MKKLFKVMLGLAIVGFMFACESTTTPAQTGTSGDDKQKADDTNKSVDTNKKDDTKGTNSPYDISADGKTLIYEINKDKYIYNKTGDFNISVTSAGIETNVSVNSYSETIDTNHLHSFDPQIEIRTDSIDILTYTGLEDGVRFRNGSSVNGYLNFVLNSFPVNTPATGTYTADGLFMHSFKDISSIDYFSSFDIEITLAQKVDNDIHLVGNFSIDNPSTNVSNMTVSFDVLAQLKPDNIYK